MGIMITYHGYNSPMYKMHKNVDARYTQQNTVLTFSLCNMAAKALRTKAREYVPRCGMAESP